MMSKIRSQPWWFFPSIAFLVGLLIGWLVIGWGVWPVTYKNALPPDLRPAERQEYLLMAAESYARSGDADALRARMNAWPADELAADLEELELRLLDVDPLQASQIQLMRTAVGLDQPAILEEPAIAPSTSGAETTSVTGFLRTACVTALWVLLVLGGILAVYYLFRRWRAATQEVSVEEPEPLPGATPPLQESDQGPLPAMDTSYSPERAAVWPEEPEATDEVATVSYDYAPEETEEETELEEDQRLSAAPATAPLPAATAVRRFTRPPAVATGTQAGEPSEALIAVAGLVKLGEYQALYQMGESDYDEGFDILDTSKSYIGQCGVELVNPMGRERDQAGALQVWLWDTNDPDTKVKVLMSEGAYRDTSLRNQLGAEHPVILARVGTEFELVSYNLLLRGVVERIEYAEQEPVGGVFAEIGVRMAAYERSH